MTTGAVHARAGRPAVVVPLVRAFLSDYVRNPVNLFLLVVVPVAFVAVAAGSLADAARLLGGPGGPAVEVNTAGWAAGFLAGIAMYFQVSAGRDTDRRLVGAGLPAARLVAARLVTGLVLAVLGAVAALATLAARTGVGEPLRTVVGTLMFATVYLAIGAVVGALVRDAVNGTVIVLFVWILDVFFGPTLSGDQAVTRAFPTHFVSLWMVDLPSRHGGRIGDLGWAIGWTLAALTVAYAVVVATTGVASSRRRLWAPASWAGQVTAGLRAGLRDYRRNAVLCALLVVVPAVFIVLADAVTPDRPAAVRIVEQGVASTQVFSLPRIHAATMAPVAVASLATLAGLFVVLDTRAADQRLALAGFRTGPLLTVRLALIAVAGLIATAVSLVVTALVFDARQPLGYAAANLLIAATYGLIGVPLGPLLGRVSGVFVAFLLPFLDIGIAQSAMLRPDPPAWARLLPGYGGSRMLIDAALTPGFDAAGSLLAAGAWILGMVVVAGMVFRATASPRG